MRPIMVQGTSSGAGKSTLVAALCRIFSDRGYDVAPFKAQNMSRHSYRVRGIEISRAQAVQAIAARCAPSSDLNPILLKPRGDDSSDLIVNGERVSRVSAREYYRFARTRGLRAALAALSRLRAAHELVIIEGAGSPAEINLGDRDIANMAVARAARAAVVLVSDIERGGAFASIAGTMSLLEPRDRRLVCGYVINKFRGDESLLGPGYARLRRMTRRPVLATLPVLDVGLPEEDSLRGSGRARRARTASETDRAAARLARAVQKRLNVRALERAAC